jgi:hypothetical protein
MLEEPHVRVLAQQLRDCLVLAAKAEGAM